MNSVLIYFFFLLSSWSRDVFLCFYILPLFAFYVFSILRQVGTHASNGSRGKLKINDDTYWLRVFAIINGRSRYMSYFFWKSFNLPMYVVWMPQCRPSG